MINQVDQPSNQYGFYAVPKALEPKKKYRETFQEEIKYEEEVDEDENQNQFVTIDREGQNQKQLDRDFYVDEAPRPEFKPKQRGLDYGVQVERQDLFDYDLEVQPLIEILVGRSVVSAINELQEQKQRKQREEALDVYQKKRNAELMQTQRLQNRHNRLQDEASRRVLQKQTYVKNKKTATQKLISRKNAKHSLLNLRNQIIEGLQDEGYLRQSTYVDLRVEYQGWLYEQIKAIVNEDIEIEQIANNMVEQKQKQIKREHQKNIQKQNKRRKDILDQRQTIKKLNEQRKQKKRIRKQRLHKRTDRMPKLNQAQQEINKYEGTEKILKAEIISNGQTKRRSNVSAVNVSGGLLNYLIAFLNESGSQISPQEVESILEKLFAEMAGKLEIDISAEHLAIIEEIKAKLEEDPIDFMTNKQKLVQELSERISLDISVLQAGGISIKRKLHKSLIITLLNIYLNALPSPKMEGEEIVSEYSPNQRDKKREELKLKIQFIPSDIGTFEEIKKSENVLRVRFQKIRPQNAEQNEPKQNQEQSQPKPVDLDQWIDIYDGQNWEREKTDQQIKEIQRQTQVAAAYNLNGFLNSFVVDERNLFYLQNQLERVLGIQAGSELASYRDRLQYLLTTKDNVPIYDVELQWDLQK